MKKFLSIALALCLMLTLFAGCSSSSDGGSTPTNSAPTGDTNNSDGGSAESKYKISDFEGTWKLGSQNVACYTINAADKTVTAYADNGIVLGTFPVAETSDGIMLKMGFFGMVPLTDPTALTVTSVPTVSDYDIKGSYEMIYGEYLGSTLDITDDSHWTLEGETYTKGPDQGTYEIINGEAQLNPTKELGGTVYHKILGGGKVLQAYQPSSRVYIEKEYAATRDGQAMAYYFDLMTNKWADAEDESFTAEFTDKGKVLISGEEMGIWYPTTTGATAEFTDGSNQYVEFTDNGIEFYYKNFVRQ